MRFFHIGIMAGTSLKTEPGTAHCRFLQKPGWFLLVFLSVLLLSGRAGPAHAYHTYTRDGIKHYVLTAAYDALSVTTPWQWNPNDANAYSKVSIHLATREDLSYICGVDYYEDGDTQCCDFNDDDDCEDEEDYIPHRDNPDRALLYITGDLTIEQGIQVEIAREIEPSFLSGRITVNGTQQQPVAISAGRTLTFSGASGSLNYCSIKNGGGLQLSGCDTLTLSNCTLSNNKADYGGGIHISGGSNILLRDTEISDNNDAIAGGGIYLVNASPTIRDCVIKNNSEAFRGGGIFLKGQSRPTIINTLICDNSAQYGGGIYNDNDSAPLIVNSMISNNLASARGGGLYVNAGAPRLVSGVISNNAVFGSYGGGIYSSGPAPQMVNTIIYGNVVGWYEKQPAAEMTFQQVYPSAALANTSFSCLQDGSCDTCISHSPRFKGPSTQKGPDGRGADADWSLAGDSACINAGTIENDTTTHHDNTDFAGNVRPYNKDPLSPCADSIRVDIGAYEFQNNPPLVLDDEDNCLAGDIIIDHIATDENTDQTVSLFEGYHAVDVDDGDTATVVVTDFPDDVLGADDDPSINEFGGLYQYPKEDPLTSDDNALTDASRRLVYEPANRTGDYTASFAAAFSDGVSFSLTSTKVYATINANPDPPAFSTLLSRPTVNAGEPFSYNIEAAFPDVDAVAPPWLKIEGLPGWLEFADNGDGTGSIAGTPDDGDIGDYDITIHAGGGGSSSSQTFTLTVKSRVELRVNVTKNKLSGAPGETLTLKATAETVAGKEMFKWRISDKKGSEIETLYGSTVYWDTTGVAAGTYIAVVTLSDDIGSRPDEKSISVMLDEAFADVDEDHRPVPDAGDEAVIEALGDLDTGDPDFDAAASAAAINEVSKLELDAEQRGQVLTALDRMSGDPELVLSDSEMNNLLGGLDNLIIAEPSDIGDRLTQDQADQALGVMADFSGRRGLKELQVLKLSKSMDELMAQQGSALTPGQTDTILDSLGKLSELPDLTDTSVFAIADSINELLVQVDSENLNPDQVSVILYNLAALAETSDLREAPLRQMVGALDKLLTGQDRGGLSINQVVMIDDLHHALVRSAVAAGVPMSIGGEGFRIRIIPVDETTASGSLVIGGPEDNAQVRIPDIDALKAAAGLTRLSIVLTCNTCAALSEEPVVLVALYDRDGNRVDCCDDPVVSLEITLPVVDADKSNPYHYDPALSVWRDEPIGGVAETDGEVSFESRRFGSFTLLGSVADPHNYRPSKKSSSNCFIQSIP